MSNFKHFMQFMNIMIVCAFAALLGVCTAVGAAEIISNVQDHFCAPTRPTAKTGSVAA